MIPDCDTLREHIEAGGAVFAVGGPANRPVDVTQLVYDSCVGKPLTKPQRQAIDDPAEGYQ